MKKATTITEIAAALNITPATVSRALSDHPEIAAKTKKKVKEYASRIGYQPNKIASSLRSGKTKLIGVLIPTAEHVFFGSVIHGISNIASKNGYDVIIYQSNETQQLEKNGIEAFLNARVDGILASIAKGTTDFSHFKSVSERNVPIAFFDRINDSLGISSILINDYKGAYLATEALIHRGYQRIAHISGPLHIQTFAERVRGYQEALRKNGMAINDQYFFEGNISIESGREGVGYFLDLPDAPDAIVAVEDFTALGAIKELKERNIRVPEDFGIFGFSNDLFGEHISPSLSTVDQQAVIMGTKAFELIHQLIGEESGSFGVVQIVLDPIIIERDSSKKT